MMIEIGHWHPDKREEPRQKLMERVEAYCPLCDDKRMFKYRGEMCGLYLYDCEVCHDTLNIRLLIQLINKQRGLESRTK